MSSKYPWKYSDSGGWPLKPIVSLFLLPLPSQISLFLFLWVRIRRWITDPKFSESGSNSTTLAMRHFHTELRLQILKILNHKIHHSELERGNTTV